MQPKLSEQNLSHSLSVLAEICDQFPVFDHVGACVASAVMKDNEIIDEQNKDLIIDKSKVNREHEKEKCNNQSFLTRSAVQALYFDGKKR